MEKSKVFILFFISIDSRDGPESRKNYRKL